MNSKSAIFFDRDGVLVDLIGPNFERGPRVMAELVIKPDASKTLIELKKLDFKIFVITNQPDLARGGLRLKDHEAITASLERDLPEISKTFTCPHDATQSCICRKPKTGLIEMAFKEFALSRSGSWLVGDKWTDILAGQEAGLRTVLCRNPWSWQSTSQGRPPLDLKPDFEVSSISELSFLIRSISIP